MKRCRFLCRHRHAPSSSPSAASMLWLPRQTEHPVQTLPVYTHAVSLHDVAQPQAKAVVPTITARLIGLGTEVDSCVCPFLMVGSYPNELPSWVSACLTCVDMAPSGTSYLTHFGVVKVCIIVSCLDADALRGNITSVKIDISLHAMTAVLSSYR